MKTLKPYFFNIFLLNIFSLIGQEISYSVNNIDPLTNEIKINVDQKKDEYIYKDFLKFSVDNPNVSIVEIKFSKPTIEKFDNKQFKQTKEIYTGNFEINLILKKIENQPVNFVNLAMHYLSSKDKNFQEKIFKIEFDKLETQKDIQDTKNPSSKKIYKKENSIFSIINSTVSKFLDSAANVFYQLKEKISASLKGDSGMSLKILLAFILGLMLSLTPCIYPMIPITVGILQQSADKTFFKNFLMAISYTLGVATTFASLGLAASLGGPAFGQLLGNPIFVIILVAFLAYLGFATMGFYEMYIPGFLSQHHRHHKGTYLSAFLFGAASGTIASPCLSPGLALILTIVASMGNKLLGFLMLFAFGVGSSMPLFLVATFSTSLSMLPKSGMWMVEIKKIFGLLLLGMCFYYLKAILPETTLFILLSAFFIIFGIYYIFSIQPHDTKRSKQFKTIVSLILITLGIFTIFQTCKKCCFPEETIANHWLTDYNSALQQAKQENKKLFIDVGAQWCSICKAIDSKIFADSKVLETLNNFVKIKIDATSSTNPDYLKLKDKYQITGFPTILIIDPTNGKLIKKWMGELYDMNVEEFIKQLESYK
ncbi:thioredoxin family protein [Candidatus Dependentiae bacterium]|nr:thioredoxin family protein [Candidatus Dependentiae bacterium]